jgi:hypothetical protein
VPCFTLSTHRVGGSDECPALPKSHCVEGLVGLRAGLLMGIKPQTLCRPSRSGSRYNRLSHPGCKICKRTSKFHIVLVKFTFILWLYVRLFPCSSSGFCFFYINPIMLSSYSFHTFLIYFLTPFLRRLHFSGVRSAPPQCLVSFMPTSFVFHFSVFLFTRHLCL